MSANNVQVLIFASGMSLMKKGEEFMFIPAESEQPREDSVESDNTSSMDDESVVEAEQLRAETDAEGVDELES